MNKPIIKKCILLFFLIVAYLVFEKSALARTDSRWWDKNEVPSLNVLNNLKAGRAGKNYYINAAIGNDKNNGLAPETAWKTIGRAFDHYSGRPAPGDVILIASGVYRERLWIIANGTVENRIIVGPYGDGEVTIDASNKIEGWTLHSDKIYKANCPFNPIAVVMDEKPLFPELSLEKLGKDKWYYDTKTKTIFIYIHDGNNPTTHDIGILEDNEYQEGIFLNQTSYVTLYGLTVKYAGGHGISVLGSNNYIEKCNLKFNGKAGITVWSYEDTISSNVEVIKNHIYHNMLRNWPRGRYKLGLWGAGGFTDAPNTKFIGNVVHKNGGEGLLALGKNGGVIFRDNIVSDNWSVNIYVDNHPNSVIEQNFIFCTNPDPNDLYNNGDKTPQDGRNFRRLRAEGIMTADESEPATFRNAKIINNIIIGCRRGITHYNKAKNSGLKDVLIANNTIILPATKGLNEDFIGINVPYNRGNNSNAVYANNIVYGTHPSTFLLSVDTGLSLGNDYFHGLKLLNNIWYHPNNLKPFNIGPRWIKLYHLSFADWLKKCQDKNQSNGNINKDPKFTDITKYSSSGLTPKSDSPIIGAGIHIDEIKTDYNGTLRKPKPDIGAIEAIKNE